MNRMTVTALAAALAVSFSPTYAKELTMQECLIAIIKHEAFMLLITDIQNECIAGEPKVIANCHLPFLAMKRHDADIGSVKVIMDCVARAEKAGIPAQEGINFVTQRFEPSYHNFVKFMDKHPESFK